MRVDPYSVFSMNSHGSNYSMVLPRNTARLPKGPWPSVWEPLKHCLVVAAAKRTRTVYKDYSRVWDKNVIQHNRGKSTAETAKNIETGETLHTNNINSVPKVRHEVINPTATNI